MQKVKTARRPNVIRMLHVVQRLEVKRDELNPMLVPTRNADANLDDLRAWRASSETLRKALPVRGGK